MKAIFLILLFSLSAMQANAGEVLRLKATGATKPFQSMLHKEDTGLYIIQWKNSVHEEEKNSLTSLGFKIISYIPDDAFLVQGNKIMAQEAETLSFVRVILSYDSSMKVEEDLTQNGIFSFADQKMVTVQVTSDANLKDISSQVSSLVDLKNGFIVAKASVSEIWSLARRSDVLWIEQYIPVKTLDITSDDLGVNSVSSLETSTGFESGTKVMNVEAAYTAGINGTGQFLAFADTGLDSGNIDTLIPDFQGQVKSAFIMGLGGASWGDPLNHGTHVAGSIAGSGVSSNGLIKGAAYGAKLVAEGLYSEILSNISIPGIPKLFEQANSEGARIHSNSWGAPGSRGRYDSFAAQADDWLFKHQDFLAVFAAGNDGGDLDKNGVIDEGTLSSPGSAKNVLTVGASKNYLLEGGIQRQMKDLRAGKDKWSVEPIASSMLSEDARGMAAFSSRGPAADGRIKPDVVAPGTNIVSARSKHPKAKPEDSWGIFNDHYLYMGGTSMATPLTSGAMGLIRQYLLQKLGVSTVSSALLKATVANTAEDLYPGQFGERTQGQEQPTRRPNNHEGWGRVNLESLVSNTNIYFIDEKTGLKTGEQSSYDVVVSDLSRPLKITMAYVDAAAAVSASKTLVNDLDLSVTDPSGKQYFPNGRSSKDDTNNMEQIDVLTPVLGAYKITVRAANVPQGLNGSQPFALVVNK